MEDSVTYSYLKHLKKEVRDSTRYLYKLWTYICLPDKKELWDFNKSITEHKEFSFTSFNELLFFVKEKWGIAEVDFKPKSETTII